MRPMTRLLGAALLLAVPSAPAVAETGGQPTPPSDISRPGGSLSEKLNDTGGVIHPQSGVDPGMQKTPPATGTMPVIPPPGEPGGRPDVVPK